MNAIVDADILHRFLFEALDIRGIVVRLGPAWRAMCAGRGYAPATTRLLGEMTAVTTILGSQLKAAGRLTFQLKGSGPVQRLVIDCEEHGASLRLRGMAHVDGTLPASVSAPELFGHGQLAMTLDLPELRQPFQSIVPLQGESVGAIFEHYLEQSEQQPSRLFLFADGEAAAGLFLQKLPAADERDADGWDRITHLAATVKGEELKGLDAITLLRRLFAEEDIRVYEPRPVAYYCPQDWDKVRAMLRAVGREEVEAALAANGEVVVHDEICNHSYRFDATAVAELFSEDRRLH
jgi:molecular chaperone Hsp33